MHRNRPLLLPLSIAAVVVATTAVGLRLYIRSAAQHRLEWDEHLDLILLRDPLPRPGFLACPPNYCQAEPGKTAPSFALGWRRLREVWTTMIKDQRRVVPVSTELDGRRLVYVEHSPVFAFPNIVTVEFVPLGGDRSSLALYSRSRYGRNDFGQNRKRVERWLATLEMHSAQIRSAPAADF